MSYEGSTELLCTRGHYQAHDVYADQPETCGLDGCTERFAWFHPIDYTNGSDERNPGSMPAIKVEIGWDDVPMTDHHGNRYFIKNPRYEPPPTKSRWRKVEDP